MLKYKDKSFEILPNVLGTNAEIADIINDIDLRIMKATAEYRVLPEFADYYMLATEKLMLLSDSEQTKSEEVKSKNQKRIKDIDKILSEPKHRVLQSAIETATLTVIAAFKLNTDNVKRIARAMIKDFEEWEFDNNDKDYEYFREGLLSVFFCISVKLKNGLPKLQGISLS